MERQGGAYKKTPAVMDSQGRSAKRIPAYSTRDKEQQSVVSQSYLRVQHPEGHVEGDGRRVGGEQLQHLVVVVHEIRRHLDQLALVSETARLKEMSPG